MNLEKWGKLFFLQIRPSLFFALTLCPIIGTILLISQKKAKLHDFEERFQTAVSKEKFALARKLRKERFLHRYSTSSPYFIDEQIEAISLLQNEKQKLSALLHHPAFPESALIQERLNVLEENRLVFDEGKIEVSSSLKEVEEKLRYPVQMDENDLKQTLAIIEDVQIESHQPAQSGPQILIKEFHLKKQKTQLETEIFEVEMDLLKREFIQ